jgi:NAD(P)-dependent dehydrogenase (short-subunit alcohol dehydrogenase family)
VLLEHKVGIVTGIGPGIGRAVALAFAREGADVALAARRPEVLAEVAQEVEALGRRAITVPTDVSDAEQCRRLADATHEAFGRVDVLVNNAFNSRPVVKLMDGDVDDWRPTMEVNLWGALYMTQAVVPYMRARGEGQVVMTSTPYRHPAAGYGAYISSKGANFAACRVLALELAAFGIRLNTVTVGSADPNIQNHFDAEGERRGVDPQVVRSEWEARIPLGRIPAAEEIAQAVLFFASDMSSAVTGQNMLVDCGQFPE